MNTVKEYWESYWQEAMAGYPDCLLGYTQDDVKDDFYSGVVAGVLLVIREGVAPDAVLVEVQATMYKEEL